MQRTTGLQLQTFASCSPCCELSHKLGSSAGGSGPPFRLRPRQQRLRRLTPRAAADLQEADRSETRRTTDVWADAGLRLQNLLSGVGDGETELMSDALQNEPAPTKLAFAGAAASIILLGAGAVCWLCGNDLLGGASLSPHSLKAAEIGLLAALPMVAIKAWSWTDDAHERFPAMDQLQRDRMEDVQPLLASMSLPQAAVAMVFDTLPTLMLGLPATLGALQTAFDGVVRGLERGSGAHLPEGLPFALALMTLASLAAGSGEVWSATDASRTEEDEVIATALVNADRYYRVMTPERPEEAARAFKNVAQAWLAQRRISSRLSGYLMAAQLLFLGLLWKVTGDLAAPAAAALSGATVDMYQMHRRLNPQADQDRAR